MTGGSERLMQVLLCVLLQPAIMLVEFFLRTERLFLTCSPRQIFAPSVHDASLAGITQAIVHHRAQVCLNGRIIDRCHYLYTVVQVTRHPVGRTDEAFLLSPGCKDKDARMLQITVNDAVDADGLTYPRNARYQRAVAPQHHVDRHARSRSLVKFLHHGLVGDMVYRHLSASGTSSSSHWATRAVP